MKKISVGTVVYKNYEDAKREISSLERFTPNSLEKEIFLVDNSFPQTDYEIKTASEFYKWAEQYNDVIIVKAKENLGFGKGNNCIIHQLDSEYHALINPDIVFTENVLSNIIQYMDDNNDVGMCIPDLMYENGERQLCCRREITVFDVFVRQFGKQIFSKRYQWHTMQDMDYSQPFEVPFAQGSFLVIRTDILKSLGGFDERFFMYLEDADLCKRVREKSKIEFFPYAKAIHKWERGSHKSQFLKRQHYISMWKYFRKWGFKFF